MNDPDRLRHPAVEGDLWTFHAGASPVIGTAIHDGHILRPETLALTTLSDDQRLREEDPYTEYLIRDLPSRIVVHRSRFEVDLNRAREGAVYLTPEQAWGLSVWGEAMPAAVVDRSLALHDAYYKLLSLTLRQLEERHGAFVVFDVHSYNHRRQGPQAPPTPREEAPDINIGTASLDRDRWADVLELLIGHFSAAEIAGRRLDVRENVAFQGRGEQARFIHQHFPKTGCALAIEFKKTFMDEWTGAPDRKALTELRALLAAAVPLVEECLGARR